MNFDQNAFLDEKFENSLLLAVESSCDDTSAAIIRGNKILANIVANQDVHKNYGGVVPELASRAHQSNIVPVVDACLKKAGVELEDLDGIACTAFPGLLGSLHVGVSFCKSMALSLGIPFIGVHHMKAHILAHFIEDATGSYPSFPFLSLTVSGGHTQIVRVDSPVHMEVIGQTKDDAAGEAFDKSAKLLGLKYPGGPLIDKYAKQGTAKFEFSPAKMSGYDFSFSGLKTSILRFLQKEMRADNEFIENNLNDLCASIQKVIVESLMKTTLKASKELGIKELALAGGVSANSELRAAFEALKNKGYNVYIPKFEYCTDNAAMIAIAGMLRWKNGEEDELSLSPSGRMPI